MSLEYFEGSAGSGKTYQLIESLKTVLGNRPLLEGEAVLGLTYMHGSRRRMHNRLAQIGVVQGRFLACTVDSLARRIVCRWRTVARQIDPKLDAAGSADFNRICRVAALVTEKAIVSSWLKARYPVVVVDELQDCKGNHLRIVQALEVCCQVIAAADDFQDLQSTGESEAVEWLHQGNGKRHVLTGNRRTTDAALLAAAGRLRSNHDCGDILQRSVMAAFNANAAAGQIARTICWKRPKDVAILTPTGPEKSPFVHDVVERLASKPIKPQGIGKNVGPFPVIWELNVEEEKVAVREKFGCTTEDVSVHELRRICGEDRGALGDLLQWAERKVRITGKSRFSPSDVTTAIDRVLQSRRAFLPSVNPGCIRAMTIYQAKNREFEGVVILWPFAVGGNLESQRRRLYNALTRAQKWAIVIVQDVPKKSRLCDPPFSRPQFASKRAR